MNSLMHNLNYYTLASSHNDSSSQFHLGIIYSKGEHIAHDMNKVIHFLRLVAKIIQVQNENLESFIQTVKMFY